MRQRQGLVMRLGLAPIVRLVLVCIVLMDGAGALRSVPPAAASSGLPTQTASAISLRAVLGGQATHASLQPATAPQGNGLAGRVVLGAYAIGLTTPTRTTSTATFRWTVAPVSRHRGGTATSPRPGWNASPVPARTATAATDRAILPRTVPRVAHPAGFDHVGRVGRLVLQR